MSKKKYFTFNKFILRYPLYNFSYSENWNIETIYEDEKFKAPLFLASPVLFNEYNKVKKQKIYDAKKINGSLYKYWSRIKTRSTPFGLFSGVVLGEFDNSGSKNIILGNNSISRIRMDMKYLYDLFIYLQGLPEIRNKILYYPNDSVYIFNNKYRFIEKKYENDSFKYDISSTDNSFHLTKILSLSKKGISFDNLIEYFLLEKLGEKEEIEEYLNDIVNSQFIKSEIEPNVIGENYLERLINILKKRGVDKHIYQNLIELQNYLDYLNNQNETLTIANITGIENIVKEINIPYDNKHLIQVDSSHKLLNSYLDKSYIDDLNDTIKLLNKIAPPKIENTVLEEFKKAFLERYEYSQISLLEALDPEIGLGYPVTYNTGKEYNNSLIQNFNTFQKTNSIVSKRWDGTQDVLIKKIIEAKKENLNEITLSDKDFPSTSDETEVKSDLLHAVVQIINDKEKNISISLKFLGEGTGVHLLSRFAWLSNELEDYITFLAKKEQINKNCEYAEISHISDHPRVANVSIRPQLTKFEISCLSNSSIDQEFIIPLSDILISITQDKIYLYSKKLKKEIIPILSNAHSFKNASFHVYRFLCDLQYQNLSLGGMVLNINLDLDFVPRIKYKSVILKSATWLVKKEDIQELLNDTIKKEEKDEKLRVWLESRQLPRYVLIQEDDNELFIDFLNEDSVDVFLSFFKKKNRLKLTEFLFNEENSIVKDIINKSYRDEIIIPLFRNDEKR